MCGKLHTDILPRFRATSCLHEDATPCLLPVSPSGCLPGRKKEPDRAILWVLYDTGIRVSELCGLRLGDFDRKHGILTVKGKGSKERRIALGNNCLRNLIYYLDRHRPDEEELAEWSSAGEDHLLLMDNINDRWRRIILAAQLMKRSDDSSVCGKSQP